MIKKNICFDLDNVICRTINKNYKNSKPIKKSIKLINELFDEEEVAVIEGGIDVSTALLKLPFNHIFFTGSPEIGKIVMRAAAENLASVTLELGGKSPTIVDETADVEILYEQISFVDSAQVESVIFHIERSLDWLIQLRAVDCSFSTADSADSPL